MTTYENTYRSRAEQGEIQLGTWVNMIRTPAVRPWPGRSCAASRWTAGSSRTRSANTA